MQFILDHINSFIVFSAVMLVIALLQLRGMQSSAETVVNYIVRSGTLDMSEILERDIMNMRTEAQTNQAIAGGIFSGGSVVSYQCGFTMSTDTTMTFFFPTLADPQADIADPTLAPVAQVMYQLTAQPGSSVSRLVEGDTLVHSLYQLDRFVAGNPNGWSDGGVVYFRIEFAERGDPNFVTPVSGNCPANLSKVRFQLQMARNGFQEITDQKSRTQLNFSRYGATVDLSNWD